MRGSRRLRSGQRLVCIVNLFASFLKGLTLFSWQATCYGILRYMIQRPRHIGRYHYYSLASWIFFRYTSRLVVSRVGGLGLFLSTLFTDNYISTDPAISDIINGYNAFVDRIEQLGLPSAIEEKPRLDVSSVIPASAHARSLVASSAGQRNQRAPETKALDHDQSPPPRSRDLAIRPSPIHA